jgi:type III restriction enzyme
MEPLPDLVVNGYYLLGADWREAAKRWHEGGSSVPPVMITVANRTETAARIKYAFDHKRINVEGLTDTERTLHIDSRVLKQAESQEEPVSLVAADEDEEEDQDIRPVQLTKEQQAEFLRRMVDTVGRIGEPGEQIQHIISVGMLSEGWDAKTVTHIMGLRAFSSQLLCEQVVGRGLRRTSYDVNEETGLFEPEYVNIFGVPFTFLPHEGGDGPPPPPPGHKTRIEPDETKRQFEISWPNIVRIEHPLRQKLSLDLRQVKPLELDASQTATQAELAAILEGKPMASLSRIDLERIASQYRLQRLMFAAAANLYDQMRPDWKGNREYLVAQAVKLVEQFIRSDLINITPPLFNKDELRRRILLSINMNRVVQHIWEAIRVANAESLEPVFDDDYPIRSTEDMRTWWTSKPCHTGKRSHINFCVFDSTWEASESFIIDHHAGVEAWAKNDHLGFEIQYLFRGVRKKYRPDFLIKLNSGQTMVLEVKGRDSQENATKRAFLDEWIKAVNTHGGFGQWCWDVSYHPGEIEGMLSKSL